LNQIEAAAGLSAQRVYQDLVCDHAFVDSYQAVKRFVRQLLRRKRPAELSIIHNFCCPTGSPGGCH
jgi:hypothetical protein